MNDFINTPVWFQILSVMVLGLMIGSYAGLLVWRLPRGIQTVHGRSQCSGCQKTLLWRDLIPVLSWAVRGGKCRCRKLKLSWHYTAIELAMAALFVTIWAISPTWQTGLLASALGFCALVSAIIILLQTGRMPIRLGWIRLACALALSALLPHPIITAAILGITSYSPRHFSGKIWLATLPVLQIIVMLYAVFVA